MGFPHTHCLSDENHWAEFTCSICQNLVDHGTSTITKCNHVFCRSCLEEWFRRKRSCPVCNQDLTGPTDKNIQGLKGGCPLGWRVLARVSVRCPLSEATSCAWTGMYSELQSHLTDSGEHGGGGDLNEQQAETHALGLKGQANELYSSGNYDDAMRLYTKAIALCPEMVTLWSNRAAAHFQLRHYSLCVADCERAVECDPSFTKAYVRAAQAHVQLGNLDSALVRLCAYIVGLGSIRVLWLVLHMLGLKHNSLTRFVSLLPHSSLASHTRSLLAPSPPRPQAALDVALELDRNATVVRQRADVMFMLQEQAVGTAAFDRGDWATAREAFSRLLQRSHAPAMLLQVARAELAVGFCDRPLRLTLQILRADQSHTDVYPVRGLCFLLTGDFDSGMKICRQAISLDPDHRLAKAMYKRIKATKAAVDGARAAADRRAFEEAVRLYATVIDGTAENINVPLPTKAPLLADMYAERGNSYHRMKSFPRALSDCARAIYIKDDCRRAWITKANVQHALGQHADTIEDYEGLLQRWGQSDSVIRSMYDRAIFETKRAARPDYYHVMGLQRTASDMEIRTAYKVCCLKYHPDKNVDKAEAEQKAIEEKFKHVGEALDILTDPTKRKLYDEGHDKESIEQRMKQTQQSQGGHHH